MTDWSVKFDGTNILADKGENYSNPSLS